MRVKLLKDVRENATQNALGQVTKEGNIKVATRPGRAPVEFVEGAIIDMSPASAAKYIEAGFAEAVTDA